LTEEIFRKTPKFDISEARQTALWHGRQNPFNPLAKYPRHNPFLRRRLSLGLFVEEMLIDCLPNSLMVRNASSSCLGQFKQDNRLLREQHLEECLWLTAGRGALDCLPCQL